MRLPFVVAAGGVAAVFVGLVLAAAVVVGFLPATAGGLIVGGAAAIGVAERMLAPVAKKSARWPR